MRNILVSQRLQRYVRGCKIARCNWKYGKE